VLAACALIGIIKIKAMKIKNDVNNADVDIHCFIEFPLSDFRLFNGQDLWQTAYQLVSAQTNKNEQADNISKLCCRQKQVYILFKIRLSVRVRQYRRLVCLPKRMSTLRGIIDVKVRH
jgi:hypothetical protein